MPIAYHGGSGAVESALESLPSVDDVTATGNAGGPWTVSFVGTHSGKNEPEMEGDASGAMSGTLEGTIDDTLDGGGRLGTLTDPGLADEGYTFDLLGNRTMPGYQMGTGNRLLNNGTYSYEYDDEGNRTRRTKNSTGEATEYEWNFRNRLTKVTEKDAGGNVTKVVEYTYDVSNRRFAKEVDTTSPFDMQDAAIERYMYDDIHYSMASLDGGNVVLDFVESDGPGGSGAITLSKRYLWGERVDELLAQEDATKAFRKRTPQPELTGAVP